MLLLVVSLSPVVPALRRDNEHTPVYIIRNVFDAPTRSAIAATGAVIIEAGKDYVLVEAAPKEKRAIEALGFIVEESASPDVSILAFPAADSAYHDYSEMVTESFAPKVVSFTPGFSPVLDGTHRQKTVSTVSLGETVKTVSQQRECSPPG